MTTIVCAHCGTDAPPEVECDDPAIVWCSVNCWEQDNGETYITWGGWDL